MTISVEIFDLFNDFDEIDFFITMLNEKKSELFDLKFNVFFRVDFLN